MTLRHKKRIYDRSCTRFFTIRSSRARGMKLAARSVRGAAACARWRLRGLTSVGWLISNRSSRLAFQWLMMSASFRRSSSRLPDILKPRLTLNLETIHLSPRWFGFIHSNGLLIRRPEIKVNLLHPEIGLSNAVSMVSVALSRSRRLTHPSSIVDRLYCFRVPGSSGLSYRAPCALPVAKCCARPV